LSPGREALQRNPSRSYILRHQNGHASEFATLLSLSQISFDVLRWTQDASNFPAVSVGPRSQMSSTFIRPQL
jgi:hypothetical protein